MNRLLLTAVALAFAPLAVLADTPAPTSAPSVPPSDCKKPNLESTANRLGHSSAVHDPMTEAQAYLDCIKAYAEQEKAAAQAHGAAANQAITDYNEFVKSVTEYQNRPKD